MAPQAFIAKWGPGGPSYELNEEQGAQSHFMGLSDLLGVPRPGSEPGYLFEQGGRIAGQASGCADVYKRGAFAWENRAPGKNLDAALRQLLGYTPTTCCETFPYPKASRPPIPPTSRPRPCPARRTAR